MNGALPYDVEVEYIETTEEGGLVYIDTGFVPDSLDLEIQCGFMPNAYAHNYSVWFTNGSNPAAYFRIANWRIYTAVNFGTSDASHDVLDNKELGIKYDVKLNKEGCTINDVEVALNTNYAEYWKNETPITIFDRETMDRMTFGRLYYFRVLRNDKAVLDLIPVRVGDEGFMYDKVSGLLMEKVGVGTFKLGPDIN